MRRAVAAALLLFLAGACSDSGTPLAPSLTKAGAAVVVAVRIKNGTIYRSIQNGRAAPVLYRWACGVDVERADGKTWTRGPGLPYGRDILCTLMARPPIRIEAGSTWVDVWTDMEAWQPGEYRFNLPLFNEDGRMLPERERRSNSFYIPLPWSP